MKKILLMFSLVLSCYAPILAQSITGEANPCPSTPNIYRLIIPSIYGIPSLVESTNLISWNVGGKNENPDGTTTWDFSVVWQNVADAGAMTVGVSNEKTKSYKFSVTIKGLSDVGFETVPGPKPCNFRGDVAITATQVTNATNYEWSNDVGWISNGSTTRYGVFTVNNSRPAFLTVKVYNDKCPGLFKSNNRGISRTQPTDTVVYSRIIQAVCPSVSPTVTVTPPSGAIATPVGYEWYAKPAGLVKINGGDYIEGSTLTTTTTSVTLSQASTSNTGFIKLYCRAIYDTDCSAPWAVRTMNVGAPTSTGFTMEGSKTLYYGVDKPLNTYSVCTREYLNIYPNNNLGNDIVAYKWEVVSGSYLTIGALTQSWLYVQIPATYGSVLNLRFQYETNCGWSDWNNLKLVAYDCATDPGTGLRVAPVDSATAEVNTNTGLTIAPNPASSNITVTLPASGTAKGNMLVSVTDVKGSTIIARKVATAERFTLDVSSLPAGTYILQVQTGSKKEAKQFVVSK